MRRTAIAAALAAAFGLAAGGAPVFAQSAGPFMAGAQTVVSFSSGTSAGNAANKASFYLQEAAKHGWTAVNVSSADMFSFVLSEQALSSGGVQGAREWDVYLLMACHPQKGSILCSLPATLPSAPTP